MDLITQSTGLTMTSQEIADLTEKRHDNVKRTIDTLAGSGVISCPQIEDGEKSANGVVQKLYLIGQRDSYVIVAQLSPEFTGRLVDRWQALERSRTMPGIPTTFAQALRLAAEQAEKIEAQAAVIEQQRPAVEFVDRFVEAKSAKGLREVSKILGLKEREFIAGLAATGVIFKQGNHWLPRATYQHAGYFEVKTGEASGHAYHQTRFTPAGIAWIADRIAKADSQFTPQAV